jgi:hypothetical protein
MAPILALFPEGTPAEALIEIVDGRPPERPDGAALSRFVRRG